MGTLIGHRIIPILIGVAVVSCGGGLTLPSDGGPVALQVVSGDGQEATVGSRLDPLVVRVVDARSQPVAGVAVVFQFESAAPDAEVSPEAETTTQGLASAEVRLGTSAGTHIVQAQVADASSGALRATFDLNALARGKHKDRGDDDDDEDDDD